MSLMISTSAQRGFTAHSVAAPAEDFLDLVDATAGGSGPTRHWRQDETSGSTMVARVGGIDGSYQNSPRLGIDPLVQDAAGGKSVGYNGSTQYATISSPITSSVWSYFRALQVDKHPSAGNKYQITNSFGNTAGHFAIELEDDGASGLWVRAFRYDSTDTPIIRHTAAGSVPIGSAFTLGVRFNADGTFEVLKDGSVLALTTESGSFPGSWPAVPSVTWFDCRWGTDIDHYNGLAAELILWDSAISNTDYSNLAVAQNVTWLVDGIDLGGIVETSATETADPAPRMHPETATSTIDTQPTGDESVAVNADGRRIDITGGADPVSGASFGFHVTANSISTPERTWNFNVVSPGGSGAFILPVRGIEQMWTGINNPKTYYVIASAADAETRIAARQSEGNNVLHIVWTSKSQAEITGSMTTAQAEQVLIDRIDENGGIVDGIIADEFSMASGEIDKWKKYIEAVPGAKAARPGRTWAAFLTPNFRFSDPDDTDTQVLRDALDDGTLDWAAQEVYIVVGGTWDTFTGIVDRWADRAPSYISKLVPLYSLGNSSNRVLADDPNCSDCDIDDQMTYLLANSEWSSRVIGAGFWYSPHDFPVNNAGPYETVFNAHYGSFL